MRYGGGFRVLAAFLLFGVVALIGLGAYGAGFAAGSASPSTTAPAWAYGGAFGVGHLIGFIITIFVLLIVVRLILLVLFGHGHRPWGRYGHWHGYWQGEGGPDRFGPSGPWGGWQRGDWHAAGQAAFDEFHNRSHGYPTAGATPGSTGAYPTSGTTPDSTGASASQTGEQPR